LDKNKIFLKNRGELSTQWSPFFYHPEKIKYENVFNDESYQFDVKKLKYLYKIKKDKSNASSVNTYIGMANIESDTGLYVVSENEKGKGDCNVFHRGEVLYGKLRPYLNKVYFAEFDGGCSTEFLVLDSLNPSVISNRFLSIFLLLNCVVKQTKYMMTGNTLPRLQTFDLENLSIPIPSPSIQQKIIDIMDDAYKLKKQKEDEANKILDSIDEYLLEQLGISLPEEEENTLENRTFQVGFSDVFNNRFDAFYNQPVYTELIRALENAKYPLVSLMELCISVRGVTYSSSDEAKTGIGILRGNNINLETNELDLSNIRYIREDIVLNKEQMLYKNDILMSAASGSKEHVGKVAFIDKDLDYYFGAFMMVLRVTNKDVNPYYLFAYLQSKFFRKLLQRILGGTNINNLNFNMIKHFKVPLPPRSTVDQSQDIQNKISNEIIQRRNKAKEIRDQAFVVMENAKKEVEKIILGDSYES